MPSPLCVPTDGGEVRARVTGAPAPPTHSFPCHTSSLPPPTRLPLYSALPSCTRASSSNPLYPSQPLTTRWGPACSGSWCHRRWSGGGQRLSRPPPPPHTIPSFQLVSSNHPWVGPHPPPPPLPHVAPYRSLSPHRNHCPPPCNCSPVPSSGLRPAAPWHPSAGVPARADAGCTARGRCLGLYLTLPPGTAFSRVEGPSHPLGQMCQAETLDPR